MTHQDSIDPPASVDSCSMHALAREKVGLTHELVYYYRVELAANYEDGSPRRGGSRRVRSLGSYEVAEGP